MAIDTNELRRLAQTALAGPDGISLNWIKLIQDFQQNAGPATILELINRLEAAESEALEQARLNGMGSEREAALMAKLEAAEKERDALRAKIEQMERQEPVAKVRVHQTGGNAGIAWSVAPLNDFDALPLMRDGDRLYALPGAKGEEK